VLEALLLGREVAVFKLVVRDLEKAPQAVHIALQLSA
jgi:hypothetical protein